MYDVKNTGPIPTDLATRAEFRKEMIPLGQLFDAAMETGQVGIVGRRFVDCIIRGPAILLPNGGTQFVDCNLGDVAGDVRNLFLKATGPKIIGGMPVDDCLFQGCLFFAVGLAGNDAFVEGFAASLGAPRAVKP
ncbi:MAG: hypothetical protein SWI22_11055 [Pseudomonadota bacterium]|nr:hypothetical protein [Pseudomonadota bacterium]